MSGHNFATRKAVGPALSRKDEHRYACNHQTCPRPHRGHGRPHRPARAWRTGPCSAPRWPKGASHIDKSRVQQGYLCHAGRCRAAVRPRWTSGRRRCHLWRGWGISCPVTGPVDCCESGSTLRFLIPHCQPDRAVRSPLPGRGRLMERPQSVYETLYREQNLRFEQALGRADRGRAH